MAVVVEVADERRDDAALGEAVADVRHGLRGLVAVDGDANQLGAGAGQRRDLGDGAVDVGGVGVGHRLHDDGCAAADLYARDAHGLRPAPWGDEIRCRGRHGSRFRQWHQAST